MLNKLNRVKLNKLNKENNEFYSNINEVSWVFNIEGEGLYKFKCGDDSNILVNSIEVVNDDEYNSLKFDYVLENIVGIKGEYEYVNIGG